MLCRLAHNGQWWVDDTSDHKVTISDPSELKASVLFSCLFWDLAKSEPMNQSPLYRCMFDMLVHCGSPGGSFFFKFCWMLRLCCDAFFQPFWIYHHLSDLSLPHAACLVFEPPKPGAGYLSTKVCQGCRCCHNRGEWIGMNQVEVDEVSNKNSRPEGEVYWRSDSLWLGIEVF